ncbi:MAG TPA: peptidylprolyl isomerase [Armatimonadota bacterium]|nr:peptidylprolyl isomerase [Armatimonadota bacterium]
MGFVNMRRNFGRHMRLLMWAFLAVFIVGSAIVFGPGILSPPPRSEDRRGDEVLAVVNGEKIGRARYETLFQGIYERWDRAGLMSLGGLEPLRARLLEEMMQERLLVAAAKQEGIKVSSRELKRELAQQVEAELKQRGGGDRDYRRLVEASVQGRKDELREQMLIQRLQQQVVSQVRTSDEDVRKSYREIRVRRLLVRIDESGKAGLSEAMAREKAEQLLAKLKAGADFAAMAQKSSDDKATAAKGGDMGFIGRGRTWPDLETTAFGLRVGQLSGLVRTPEGYEIIKVEAERSNLPADFDRKRAEYRRQYAQQQQTQVWGEFMERLQRQARVEIRDPEMRAAKAMTEGKIDVAIAEFKQALKHATRLGDQVHAAICFSLGGLYSAKGKWGDARDMYERSLGVAMSGLEDVFLALGRTYAKLGDRAEALDNYKLAEDEAPDNDRVRQELLIAYQGLGEKAAAARQLSWMQERERKLAEDSKRAEAAARKSAGEAQRKAGASRPGETQQPPAAATPPD